MLIPKRIVCLQTSKDRASKIVSYLGNIIVNGHNDITGRNRDLSTTEVQIPISKKLLPQNNYVEDLKKMGSEKFTKKIKEIPYTLITDTTMRDAHQSLLATRMRTDDIVNIAEYYSKI